MDKTTLLNMKIYINKTSRISSLITFIILSVILFLPKNTTAQTFPNPTTLSTGQGPVGTIDPLWLASPWFLTAPPNPMGLTYISTLINNSCAPSAWVDPASLAPPMNNGNWITGSDGTCATNTNEGYRYFRLTLDLPADCNGFSVTQPNNYILDLIGYADNTISNVFINGNPTGISGGGYGPTNQLNIHLVGPWVVGTNYVDVLIYNTPAGGGSNPYGLFLVADATTSSTMDTDGDGITNNLDLCPCSPGTNPYGCNDPVINNCDINAIRTAFLNAGCIELPQCTSGCSMYFLNPTSMTGNQAQSFAQSLGANLISVQSAQENQCMLDELVRLNQTGVIWIGLNDEAVEGTFVWYDQSPVTYTNWATNEPNNSGGNEDCVQIYPTGANPGKWNDLPCTSSNAKSIIEVNLCPVINAGNDVTICRGSSTNLLSTATILGSSPYTYLWNNGVSTLNNTVSPTVTDTFSIVTVDRYSCTMSDTVIVNVNQLPLVSAGPDIVVCPEETVTLSGTGANTYAWDNGITDGTAFTPSSSSADFIVTGTDANNCVQKDTVNVSVQLVGCPNFPNNFTCDIDAIRQAFTTAGCVELVGCVSECSMYFLNQQSLSGSDAQAFAQNLGANLVSIQTQGENDCIVGSLVNLGLNSVSDVIWIGLNDELTEGTFVWYDQSPVNYTNWAPGEPNNAGDEDCVQIYPDGKWNDLNCGVGTAKSVIEVNLCPVVNAGIDRIICKGETVNLSSSNTVYGSNPYTYEWTNGAQTQNTSVTPTQSGEYAVTSIDRYQCTTKDTMEVTVNPLPQAAFTTNDECFGTTVNFANQSTVSSGTITQHDWDFDDASTANTSNATHTYSNSNTYNVMLTVTTAAGCKDSVEHAVTVFPIPATPIITNNSPVECPGDIVIVSANSIAGATYIWTGPNGFTNDESGFTFSAEFANQGTYDVYVTVNNCPSDLASTIVTILGSYDPVTQEFPNVITPNKDGVNDFLDIDQYFTSCVKYQIVIWNRWGNIVYEQKTGEKPFEGRDKSGGELSDGVYFYKLTYGESETNGTITIVR